MERKYIKEMAQSPYQWKPIGSTSYSWCLSTERAGSEHGPLRPAVWATISMGSFPLRPGFRGSAYFHVLSCVCIYVCVCVCVWVWRGGKWGAPKPQTTFKCMSSTWADSILVSLATLSFLWSQLQMKLSWSSKVPEIKCQLQSPAVAECSFSKKEVLIDLFVHTNFIVQRF